MISLRQWILGWLCEGRISNDDSRAVLTMLDEIKNELRGACWHPIETALEKAPKDTDILVYCPEYSGLSEMVSVCRYHEDAGFCVDELRMPTHWMPVPKGPFRKV
jgi:hypothetical protein